MNLIYKKGNLFDDLEQDDIIMHSCNLQGNWGAGFAKELANRYPSLYKEHVKENRNNKHIIGDYELLESNYITIASIFTSFYYGKFKCSPEKIKKNTHLSLSLLLNDLREFLIGKTIKSPKINSGYFGVPWKETEEIIKEVFKGTDITWIIYEL